MRKLISWSLLTVAMVLAAGCGPFKVDPVSLQGQPIVGFWFYEGRETDGDHFYQRLFMHVKADGHVLYANLLCRFDAQGQLLSESRLNLNYMSVKRISTKRMVLQNYPLTPKFQLLLSAWPDQGSGVFEVDKLPLKPISSEQQPNFESWQCAS